MNIKFGFILLFFFKLKLSTGQNVHAMQYTTVNVNVGTHKRTAESKNGVNRGYLVVPKGKQIGYSRVRNKHTGTLINF